MVFMDDNIDIVPHTGLGGINLGDFLGDLNIAKNEIKIVNSQKIASINNGTIFILFSKDSRVIQVSARNGYRWGAVGEVFGW